jgi:serine/threonine protein phosphatase PrpC
LPAELSLGDGRVLDCSAWGGAWPLDASRPLAVVSAGRPYRLYALGPSCWPEASARVWARARTRLAVLPPVEVVPAAGGAVVVAAGSSGRPALAAEESADEVERLHNALAACRALAAVLQPLHQAGLVWLNFDPDALQAGDAGPQIANLDLRLFAVGTRPTNMRPSPAYSPPEVHEGPAERIGRATDVFHACAYLYYRLAGLLPAGFPGRGLAAFAFEFPPLRVYRPHLPAGVAPVLERGLAPDPRRRFPDLPALLDAFTDAVGRAARRCAARAAVRLDVGSATAGGRAHLAQGLPNQDAHAVLTLGPDRLLLLVADGVTHARVGSGEVASQAAVGVLGCCLPPALDAAGPPEVETALAAGCLQASRAILELARGVAPAGEVDPADSMSSTVLIGLAEGNALTLACAGDSRAYLVADGRAEQLTVDGDVRCMALAAGVGPEDVRALGEEAGALYAALGAGEPAPGGGLRACVGRCTPQVSRWRLLPGDVVVLCTDGLVEEGAFLEPAELPGLVAGPGGQSAAAVAARLTAAARARHRDPSAAEPAGSGDDVTCVVLAVAGTE